MTEETKTIKDKKYVCPSCEFESSIPGYCPVEDEHYMKKVCECDSGLYAGECCEPELEEKEKEMEKAIEEEFSQEVEKEIKQSLEEEESLDEEASFDEDDN